MVLNLTPELLNVSTSVETRNTPPALLNRLKQSSKKIPKIKEEDILEVKAVRNKQLKSGEQSAKIRRSKRIDSQSFTKQYRRNEARKSG